MDYEDSSYRKLYKMTGSDYVDLADLHRIEQEQKMVKDLLPGYKICSTPSLRDACIQSELLAQDLDDMSGFSLDREAANELESMGITLSSVSQTEIYKIPDQLSIHEAYLMPDFIGIKFSQKTHILLKDTKKTTTITLNPELLDTDEIALKVVEWPIGELSLSIGGYSIFPNTTTDLPHYINVSTEFKKFSLEENMLYGMDPQHAERERAAWRQKERRERRQLKELQEESNQAIDRKSRKGEQKTKTKEREVTITAEKTTQTLVHIEPNSFSEDISEFTESTTRQPFSNKEEEEKKKSVRNESITRKQSEEKKYIPREDDLKEKDVVVMSNNSDDTIMAEDENKMEEIILQPSNPTDALSVAAIDFKRLRRSKKDQPDTISVHKRAINWKSIVLADSTVRMEDSEISVDNNEHNINQSKEGSEENFEQTIKQRISIEENEKKLIRDMSAVNAENIEPISNDNLQRETFNGEHSRVTFQNNGQPNFIINKKDKQYIPHWNTENEDGAIKSKIYKLNWNIEDERRQEQNRTAAKEKESSDRSNEMNYETTEALKHQQDKAYSLTPSGNSVGQIDTLDYDDASDNTTKDVSDIPNSQIFSDTQAVLGQISNDTNPRTVDEVSDFSENENDLITAFPDSFANDKNQLNQYDINKETSKKQMAYNDFPKSFDIRDECLNYPENRIYHKDTKKNVHLISRGNDPPLVDSSQIIKEMEPLRSEFDRIVAELKKIELETEMLSMTPSDTSEPPSPRNQTFYSQTSREPTTSLSSLEDYLQVRFCDCEEGYCAGQHRPAKIVCRREHSYNSLLRNPHAKLTDIQRELFQSFEEQNPSLRSSYKKTSIDEHPKNLSISSSPILQAVKPDKETRIPGSSASGTKGIPQSLKLDDGVTISGVSYPNTSARDIPRRQKIDEGATNSGASFPNTKASDIPGSQTLDDKANRPGVSSPNTKAKDIPGSETFLDEATSSGISSSSTKARDIPGRQKIDEGATNSGASFPNTKASDIPGSKTLDDEANRPGVSSPSNKARDITESQKFDNGAISSGVQTLRSSTINISENEKPKDGAQSPEESTPSTKLRREPYITGPDDKRKDK